MLLNFSRDGKKAVQRNCDEGLCYLIFAVIITAAAQLFSDRIFSAIITLSASIQCLGFILLRLKVRKQRGVQGISEKSLQLYAVALSCRLYSTLLYNGYLPDDRSGDWLYQSIDLVSLAVVCSLIHAVKTKHNQSYNFEADTCSVKWVLLVVVVLSFFVHPRLNNRRIPDVAWTCALYIETVAMVPQLWMLTKLGGDVESLASHYIACIFTARVLMMCFWLHAYDELRPRGSDFNLPGLGVMGTQLLQIVIFADFMWYYVRSIRTNMKLVLPQSFVL